MIPKNPVKIIGLKKAPSGKLFTVAGYEKLGFYPASKKRQYHDYKKALDYSLVLRDYYQCEVVEF